mgnify:CR=1 FL=1
MLDAGELPGWVQKMMGHKTLQMIHENYYSYVKDYRKDEGSAFMEKVYEPVVGATNDRQQCKIIDFKNLRQIYVK